MDRSSAGSTRNPRSPWMFTRRTPLVSTTACRSGTAASGQKREVPMNDEFKDDNLPLTDT